MGLFKKIKKVAGGLAGGLTGVGGANAAKRGARAQQRYLQEGLNALSDSYGEQRNLLDPQLKLGNEALTQYGKLFGIGTANGTPDYSQFFNSPGYQFTLGEGENAISRAQSARGNLFSGGAGKELTEYATGLADQGYNNYANRLGSFANLGPQTANALAGYAGQYGQGRANLLAGIGDAKAAGYVGAANSYSNAAANLLNFGSSFVPFGGGGGARGNGAQAPTTYDPSQFRISGYNPSGMFG